MSNADEKKGTRAMEVEEEEEEEKGLLGAPKTKKSRRKSGRVDSDGDSDSDDENPDEDADRSPLMELAERMFQLGLPDDVISASEKGELVSAVMEQVKSDQMAPYYEHVCATHPKLFARDAALADRLVAENETRFAELDAAIEDARENHGDSEVRDAQMAKAEYYARIGDKEGALREFTKTLEQTVGASRKVDVVLAIIRLGFLHDDSALVAAQLAKAKQMVEAGGDWERRNLLKIYEATFKIQSRKFKEAAELLLDSIATFTCYELYSYETFIFYTVLASVVALDRKTLRDKVVKAPEVLSVYRDIPHCKEFLESLHACQYDTFFAALSNISPSIQRDRYFSAHFTYYLREIRVVAYRQFLLSYRSVTLESMARAFGVSVEFLDRELSRFIAGGRLSCKIDKVNGVAVTNRPDSKNAQYHEVVREGDLLLNRVQKLTKRLND